MHTEEQGIVVAVSPASALAARPRLFAALEAAFPVSFVASADGPPPADVAGLIAFAQDGRLAAREDLARPGLPVLALHGDGDEEAGAEDFELLRTPVVDARLRDVVLSGRLCGAALDPDGDEVLAVAGSGPAWTASPGPAPVYRVRSALAELGRRRAPLRAALLARAGRGRPHPLPARRLGARRLAPAAAARDDALRRPEPALAQLRLHRLRRAASSTPTRTATTRRWR